MHSFLVTPANIAVNNISLKITFFGLHFHCTYSGPRGGVAA